MTPCQLCAKPILDKPVVFEGKNLHRDCYDALCNQTKLYLEAINYG